MARTADAIARDFDALTVADFDMNDPDSDGSERLYALCDEAEQIGLPCMPAMFDVMERLDRADLGTPGPLVHTIERWRGQYEDLLASSVRRKPSPLTVLMVNRILNTRPADADSWLDLLRGVRDHPLASPETKADAHDYLQFQTVT